MSYSKYNDISSLLIELCDSFSDDELKMLSSIGEKMFSDSAFDRAYTLAVKAKYLENIRNIKNGVYTPISFSELNNQICSKIANNEQVDKVLLPEYAKFDHLDNKKDKLNLNKTKQLKQRILELHKCRYT